MIYLIYITVFILGIICGRWTKEKMPDIKMPDIKLPAKESSIKVLHKAEPTTYDQKRAEAIKENKPIIKTFHK